MKTIAIINPSSGNGRTGRARDKIAAALGRVCTPLTVAETSGPNEATHIAHQALLDGYRQIIAVGGDGTINEVVNGFFRNGLPVNADAQLALVTAGTGGDFRKTFDIGADLSSAIERIQRGQTRLIDIGRVSFVADERAQGVRYFANIASLGLSGEVVRHVNGTRWTKRVGSRFAYSWASIQALLRYKSRPIRLKIDKSFDEVVTVSTVAICNGRYFGGGMRVAPDAEPDDGLLDIVILMAAPRHSVLRDINKIYNGQHVHSPYVKVIRGRTVIATPVEATQGLPIYLDVDGEAPGQLPAMFEAVPRAIKLVC